MNSYHPEDHDDNESALRAMLHIVAGIALQESQGIPMSAEQRYDLTLIARDSAIFQETQNIIKRLAR